MNAFLERFALPLLARDFRAQAERRSTYVIRALCAVALYFCALMFGLYANQYTHVSAFWYMGKGREILSTVFVTEMFGVYLLMPAWLCGAIAGEKEKQTLTLLLGTRLGPWRILMEKYLAAMLRVAILLTISLPILAVAYPLGGITAVDTLRIMWSLALCALNVGAITLFCSSLCATTAAAYLMTYAILFLMLFGPSFLAYYLSLRPTGNLFATLFPNLGVAVFYPFALGFSSFYAQLTGSIFSIVGVLLYYSIPVFIQTAFFLLLARWVFVSRALNPQHSLLKKLRKLFASGPALKRLAPENKPVAALLHTDLPQDQPIVWRENRGTGFGHALRISLTLLAVLIKVSYLAQDDTGREFEFIVWSLLEYFAALLWIIAIGTGIFQREQARQTLDVLIATPLLTKELIIQKLQRAWRVGIWIFGYFALSTILNLLVWLVCYHAPSRNQATVSPELYRVLYSLNFVALALVYAPIVFWLSFGISLRTRSQGRALIATVITVIAWAVLPMMLTIAFFSVTGVNAISGGEFSFFDLTLSAASFASPLVLQAATMTLLYRHWLFVVITLLPTIYMVHIVFMLLLRWLCLYLAVLKLGRLDRHDAFNPWSIEPVRKLASRIVETAP